MAANSNSMSSRRQHMPKLMVIFQMAYDMNGVSKLLTLNFLSFSVEQTNHSYKMYAPEVQADVQMKCFRRMIALMIWIAQRVQYAVQMDVSTIVL